MKLVVRPIYEIGGTCYSKWSSEKDETNVALDKIFHDDSLGLTSLYEHYKSFYVISSYFYDITNDLIVLQIDRRDQKASDSTDALKIKTILEGQNINGDKTPLNIDGGLVNIYFEFLLVNLE